MRGHRQGGRWVRAAWVAAIAASWVVGGACGRPMGDPQRKLLEAVLAVRDPGERLQAAATYLWNHPASAYRSELARGVVRGIAEVRTPERLFELGEAFRSVFDTAADLDLLAPIMGEAFMKSGQAEDLFRLGRFYLLTHPDDVQVLTLLARIAFEQMVNSGNPAFLQTGVGYARRAITLMEANKRPAGVSEADWDAHRTRWLPVLYRELGALALRAGNWNDALAKLDKAAALQPSDPLVFRLLGNLATEQYQLAAREGQLLSGPPGAAAQRRALERLDGTIELYARAVGLAAGEGEHQKLSEELLPRLTEDYVRRYGSTDGLAELIERARNAPWPPPLA